MRGGSVLRVLKSKKNLRGDKFIYIKSTHNPTCKVLALAKKILILAFMMMLLIACKKTDDKSSSTAPFIGGSQGVELSFLDNSPPKEVFDGGEFLFDAVVKLKNNGEWFIEKENIKIIIDGVRPEEFKKTTAEFTKQPDDDLSEKQKNADGSIIESNPVFVEFKNFNHEALIVGASQPFPLRASACYSYGTVANTLLCARKDIMSAKQGICNVNEAKTIFNSGAPVQFAELKESKRATNKIGFAFKVVHAGTGNLFKPENDCDFSSRTSMDIVHLTVDTGMNRLSCSGLSKTTGTALEGDVVLYGGEKVISCVQELSSPADYEFPLILEAEYTYSNDISTTLTVKRSES